MTTSRRYSRSPITEAIIDFQVEPPEGADPADLVRCQDAAYPFRESWVLDVGQANVGEAVSTSATAERVGFRFASADQKQLFQVHFGGFTVRRLAPYQGWESFRDEARRLWGIYRQVACPRRVTRAAVRYINRFDLPLPVKELQDYLRTSPEASADLPQLHEGVSEFYMQLKIAQRDINSTLMLREVLVPSATPEVVSIILDIDLFRSDELPYDDAGIWAFVESLRARKNDIFEACITDRTRELIQ